MPVSHSHQLLCVPVRLSTTVVSLLGFAGSVTSQISCALPPSGRSKYHLPFTPRGSVLPLHTRTICAPPVRRSSPVGNVREVFGLRRIGHIDDRCPAHFQLAGQRIHERLLVVVVTDVCDLPAVLIDDDRLVGGSSLEVVVANDFHVPLSTGDPSDRERVPPRVGAIPLRSTRPAESPVRLARAASVRWASRPAARRAGTTRAMAGSDFVCAWLLLVSGSEPEYHVELRRPRRLLVVLNQVEVRVVRQVCAGPVPFRVAA